MWLHGWGRSKNRWTRSKMGNCIRQIEHVERNICDLKHNLGNDIPCERDYTRERHTAQTGMTFCGDYMDEDMGNTCNQKFFKNDNLVVFEREVNWNGGKFRDTGEGRRFMRYTAVSNAKCQYFWGTTACASKDSPVSTTW